jgi:anti-anti-sigma factor
MELRTETRGNVSILRPEGRISFANGDQELSEMVRTQIRLGCRKILIDFDKVSYIDSSGIGELVGCAVFVKAHRGELKLCEMNAHTFNWIKLVTLHSVFQVEETEAEALMAFW